VPKIPNYRRAKIHRNYTVEEAARVLGVHRNTVRHLARFSAVDPRIDVRHDLALRIAQCQLTLESFIGQPAAYALRRSAHIGDRAKVMSDQLRLGIGTRLWRYPEETGGYNLEVRLVSGPWSSSQWSQHLPRKAPNCFKPQPSG
jgi:hypothetical protein